MSRLSGSKDQPCAANDVKAACPWLPGKDSNLDYLVQSQACYRLHYPGMWRPTPTRCPLVERADSNRPPVNLTTAGTRATVKTCQRPTKGNLCHERESRCEAMNSVFFVLVTFFHNLFTAIWIGGLLVTAVSFLPSLKETLKEAPKIQRVMAAFQRRQSLWVYISIVGLIVTGVLMTNRSPKFDGFLAFSNGYSTALSIKHVLVFIMVAISLFRTVGLKRTRVGSAEKERLSLRLLLANASLGVLVLLASAIVASLARPLAGG